MTSVPPTLHIPKKDVDFDARGLEQKLVQAGMPREQAHALVDGFQANRIFNDRPKWLELERWAQVLGTSLASVPNVDCIVDPAQTVDQPKATPPVFTTVASAVNTMVAAGFTQMLRVGMIPRYTSPGGSVIQAVDQAAVTTWPRSTLVAGLGPVLGNNNETFAAPFNSCYWNMNGKAHALSSNRITLQNLAVDSGAKNNFFVGGGSSLHQIFARNTRFYGLSGASATQGVSLGTNTLWADQCHFHDAAHLGTTWLDSCLIVANVTGTSQQWGGAGTFTIFNNCDLSPATAAVNPFPFIFVNQSTFILGLGSHNNYGTGTTDNQRTEIRLNGTGGHYISTLSGALGGTAMQQAVDINLTVGGTLYASGQFGKITVVAPGGTSSQVGHSITGNCLSADVTGPAEINLITGTSAAGTGVTIRGEGVVGIVRSSLATVNVTALTYVGATRSNIVASVNLAPTVTSSGQKPYSFDAASSRNILIIVGTASLPVAGTDAGANDLIITEAGVSGPPSGPAGGDLAGTYPNPTLGTILTAGGPTGDATHTPVVTWDAKGRLTAVSSAAISGAGLDTSAVHSGDTAGGELAGTYPNPTIAARTAPIVDQKVFCKAIQTTVQLIPATTFTAVTFDGADIDDALNMHDPTTNNTRITVPYTGMYMVTGSIWMNATAGGSLREAAIRVNGTSLVWENRQTNAQNAGAQPSVQVSGPVFLNSGDYIEIMALNDVTGGLNTLIVASRGPFAAVSLLQRTA